MNKDQTYQHIMSMLKEYCPSLNEGVIFFIKNSYVYHMSTNDTVTNLEVNIKKNFEESIPTDIANNITNKLNSDIPSGYYVVEYGTYVYRRVVPLAVLSTKKDLESFLKDIEIKSRIGYQRLTECQTKKQEPKLEEIKILVNPFSERTTKHEN